jgi:RNA polymerase sigma-70 factor (ECF subfamily)
VTLYLVTDPKAECGQVDPDDATLAGLVTAGDSDALAVLYQRHGAACYRLARQVTASDTLAEDAVQEAFLVLWRSPSSYAPGRGSLRSWLLSLAHNKAVDFVRRETAQQRRQTAWAAQRVFDPPPEEDPAAASINGMQAETVRAALAELPEAQRQALALAYFGGYTQREIAELTGVPLGTVKTRTFAAMRRLHSRLAALTDRPGRGTP